METALKEFIHKLVGVKYQWWMEGPTGQGAPFYAENGSPPPLEDIRSKGLNCAGFLNLIRRHQGLEVAGAKEALYYAGGTAVWFHYFQEKGLLKSFVPTALYPEGTLFLRDYTSVFDQGHIAIGMGMNRIAHCYPDDPNPVANVLVQPGVLIEPLNLSMNWDSKGFYTHIVQPEDWLSLSCKTPLQTE